MKVPHKIRLPFIIFITLIFLGALAISVFFGVRAFAAYKDRDFAISRAKREITFVRNNDVYIAAVFMSKQEDMFLTNFPKIVLNDEYKELFYNQECLLKFINSDNEVMQEKIVFSDNLELGTRNIPMTQGNNLLFISFSSQQKEDLPRTIFAEVIFNLTSNSTVPFVNLFSSIVSFVVALFIFILLFCLRKQVFYILEEEIR